MCRHVSAHLVVRLGATEVTEPERGRLGHLLRLAAVKLRLQWRCAQGDADEHVAAARL